MAADSLLSGDYADHVTLPKVREIVVDGKVLVAGVCGSSECAELFFDWLGDGKEKPSLGDKFEALVFSEDGLFWYAEKLRGVELTGSQTIGSGCQYAISAMHCGKTAVEAVTIAGHFDVFTGGETRWIDVNDALARETAA